MYTKIDIDSMSSKNIVSIDEINELNKKLEVLEFKIKKINLDSCSSIMGPDFGHINILKNSIDRLIILVLANSVSYEEACEHVSKIEKYFDIIFN